MKNILFICESYHYGASPNGICVRKTAEEMKRQGHAVRVITFHNDVNQPEVENINGVEVHRVNAGLIETTLYKNKARKNIFGKLIYNAALMLSRLNGLLHAFRYPLLSERQVSFMYRKAEELYQEEKIDYVVSAYHKIADILAGITLKKKHPSIKLVLYTLDAISGGWVPDILHSARIPMNSLKRWEHHFFAHIDKMFAMESHRSFYSARKEYDCYAEKIEFLDIPLLAPKKLFSKTKRDVVKLVYTGSMHPSTANPHYLLKLLPMIEQAELHIYGNVCHEIEDSIKAHTLFEKRVFLCGVVAHEKIAEIQQQADVLLNFGNSNPNMIPCKIFEYMSTGNKILSFTHADTDSSLPYIRKYPSGLIVEEKETMLEQNAAIIRRFLAAEAQAPSPEELCRLFEKNTPAYFCKRLLEV